MKVIGITCYKATKSTKLIITAEQILVLEFKGKGKNNLTALKELDSS